MNQLPEDDMLRHFWLESKKEAPLGFSDAIMQNLPQHKPLPEALKKPLLSLKAAGFLTSLLALLALLLNSLGSSDKATSPFYEMLQQGLNRSLGWLAVSGGDILPILAVLSVAVVLLIGLDELLKRFLHRTPQID